MGAVSEYVALVVNDQPVTLGETLRQAMWSDKLGFLKDTAVAKVICQAAAERGITVSDVELQEAADAFRMRNELYGVDATHKWLEARGQTVETWEAHLEQEVLSRKLMDAISEGKVEQFFAENKLAFEAATLSHIVVDDEGVAGELHAQIADEGEDFYALARQYSLDEKTRGVGGTMGRVGRKALVPALQAAVYGTKEGEVTSPVRAGKYWHLIKVEQFHTPVLDDTVRAQIKAVVFAEWLAQQQAKASVNIPLLDEI